MEDIKTVTTETVSGNDPAFETEEPVAPEPEKVVDPVTEMETEAPDPIPMITEYNTTIIAESSNVDESGFYRWTYKDITKVAIQHDSEAYRAYYEGDSWNMIEASNGDLVLNTDVETFEEFLFYRSGTLHVSGVRTFDSLPGNESISGSFTEASDGAIVHKDELAVYEQYLEDDAQNLYTLERQIEQDEQINEYLESINENLVYLTEMGFADREDLQALVTSMGFQLDDNVTLGQNLQVMYESLEKTYSSIRYLTYSTTVIGFLLALSAGIAIAKLVIERFR